MPGHCFANRLAALTADRLTSALGSFISATRVVPSLADVRAEALEPPVAFWEDKETKARRERKERDRKAPCVAGALGARGRHRACVPPGCFNCLRAHRTWPINEAKTRASVPLDATVASECTAISPSTQPPPAPLPTPNPAPHRDLHQQSADQSSSHLSQGHGVAARVRQGDVSNNTQMGRHHGGREPESAANNHERKGRGEDRQTRARKVRGA